MITSLMYINTACKAAFGYGAAADCALDCFMYHAFPGVPVRYIAILNGWPHLLIVKWSRVCCFQYAETPLLPWPLRASTGTAIAGLSTIVLF
jgi:hypothetical protein